MTVLRRVFDQISKINKNLEQYCAVETPGTKLTATATAILGIFLSMALVTLAGAMSRVKILGAPEICFAIFFIAFRIKWFLDDLNFFSRAPRDRWFKGEFVVGIIAWFFWIVAALHIDRLSETVWPLMLAIGLGTLWVILEWCRTNM